VDIAARIPAARLYTFSSGGHLLQESGNAARVEIERFVESIGEGSFPHA